MNKQIENAVLGYVGKESRQDVLQSGDHVVSLIEMRVLNSRVNWDESDKTELPDFVDPTPQLGIMFGNEHGVQWHRFNIYGYVRWDELTDDQQGDDKYAQVVFGKTVYACKRHANGNLVRIKDKKRTEDAESFLDQFLACVNGTGKTVADACAEAIAGKTEFVVSLEDDEYEGKDQIRVSGFSKVKQLGSTTEDEDFGS